MSKTRKTAEAPEVSAITERQAQMVGRKAAVEVLRNFSTQYGVNLNSNEVIRVVNKAVKKTLKEEFMPSERDIQSRVKTDLLGILRRKAKPEKVVSSAERGKEFPEKDLVTESAVEVYSKKYGVELTHEQWTALETEAMSDRSRNSKELAQYIETKITHYKKHPEDLTKLTKAAKAVQIKAPERKHIAMLTFKFKGGTLKREDGTMEKLPEREFRVYFKVTPEERKEINQLSEIKDPKLFQAKARQWYTEISVYRPVEDPSSIVAIAEGIGGKKPRYVYRSDVYSKRDKELKRDVGDYDRVFANTVADYRTAGLAFNFDQKNTRARPPRKKKRA